MNDMEYTLDERVIRKPAHDTPEAALAAAWHTGVCGCPDEKCSLRLASREVSAAILAAMPDWTLVPRVATADWTGSARNLGIEEVIAQANSRQATAEAEIARLRAALSFHNKTPTGMTRKCLPGCVACAALAGGSDGS